MERNVKRKETKRFSEKCYSQMLASELFPQKNELKKFTEQCKMNFFFPDGEFSKPESVIRLRRQASNSK